MGDVDIFSITVLTAWGYTRDFQKMLPKFRMAARGQLHIFCARKKLKTEVIFFQILQSHSQRHGDVHVFFKGFNEIQNGRHGSTS